MLVCVLASPPKSDRPGKYAVTLIAEARLHATDDFRFEAAHMNLSLYANARANSLRPSRRRAAAQRDEIATFMFLRGVIAPPCRGVGSTLPSLPAAVWLDGTENRGGGDPKYRQRIINSHR